MNPKWHFFYISFFVVCKKQMNNKNQQPLLAQSPPAYTPHPGFQLGWHFASIQVSWEQVRAWHLEPLNSDLAGGHLQNMMHHLYLWNLSVQLMDIRIWKGHLGDPISYWTSSGQYFYTWHLLLLLYFSFKGLRARKADLQVRHLTSEASPWYSSSDIPWYLSLISPDFAFSYVQPITP